MWGILLAIPVLGVLTMLQTAVISRSPLLSGTADLILVGLIAWSLHERVQSAWYWALAGGLMVSYVTALPFWTMPAAYLGAVAFARLIRRRVWKAPILAMLAAVFAGTVVVHLFSLLAVSVQGTLLPVIDVINLITIPSLVLNLMVALPMYVVLHDLANWAYPEEFDV